MTHGLCCFNKTSMLSVAYPTNPIVMQKNNFYMSSVRQILQAVQDREADEKQQELSARCRQQSRLRSMLDMDSESPVLPVVASKDPHSLEDAARTALGTQPDTCDGAGVLI